MFEKNDTFYFIQFKSGGKSNFLGKLKWDNKKYGVLSDYLENIIDVDLKTKKIGEIDKQFNKIWYIPDYSYDSFAKPINNKLKHIDFFASSEYSHNLKRERCDQDCDFGNLLFKKFKSVYNYINLQNKLNI